MSAAAARADERGGGACRIGGAGDGHADVGLLERGGVVDAVAGHGHAVAGVLQGLDDAVLVFGEDLGEAVGGLDALGQVGGRCVALVAEHGVSGGDAGADT